MRDYGLKDRVIAYMKSLDGKAITVAKLSRKIGGKEDSVRAALLELAKQGSVSRPRHQYFKWVEKRLETVETPEDNIGALRVALEHHPELGGYMAHFLLGAKMPKDVLVEMHNHVKHTEGQRGFTSEDSWAYMDNLN